MSFVEPSSLLALFLSSLLEWLSPPVLLVLPLLLTVFVVGAGLPEA